MNRKTGIYKLNLLSKICFLLLLICNTLIAQDNFVLTSINRSDLKIVKIKWYSKAFLYPEGVNIYRKEASATTWQKINTTPIKKGDYKPSVEEFAADKELKQYMAIANSIKKMEGVPLLGAYVKSFKSEAFSKFLGIEFIDNTSPSGRSVQYKACALVNNTEQEIGISATLICGTATEILPPTEIDIAAGNKRTSIKWLPETSRYYAVNIYRMFDSTGTDRIQVNKDPIIVSKTKNKEGKYEYPKQFYIDEKLKEDTIYYYSFRVIDFFGQESEYSKPIKVFVKDQNAPIPPYLTYRQVNQKNVTLKWHKPAFEKDFTGFNIYRAYRSEKNYTLVNKKLLLKTDTVYTDTTIKFGAYRYVIASIDRSGNEGVTEEIALETIDEEPPAVPKNLVIRSDTGKVFLSWEKNKEEDLWGYMIYQTVNKNTTNDAYVLITPDPITNNQFKQELAKNSKNKFLYKVLAIDSSYNKSALSDFAATTLPDVIAPSEPFITNCSINSNKNITIEFFKNTERDLKGYDLYRIFTEENEEKTEKVNAKIIDKTAYRYIDREFENYGLVKYYMIAIDSTNNESKKSNLVKLNIKKEEENVSYEFKSFNTKALKIPHNWQLKWKINNDEDIFYVVYTKESSGENFEPQTKNLSNKRCIVNLKNTNKAFVQVRAYNAKGLVAKSEIKLLESKK